MFREFAKIVKARNLMELYWSTLTTGDSSNNDELPILESTTEDIASHAAVVKKAS